MSAVVFVNAQVITASGNSADGYVGPITGNLSIFVNVSAASGTLPTMDLTMEWSPDGTTWYPAQAADTFTQVTAAVKAAKIFITKAPHFRLVWAVGGTTPSFTLTATVVAYPSNQVPRP